MKLTSWFSGDQKPIRVGVYERKYHNTRSRFYCYWNGCCWSVWALTVGQASYLTDYEDRSIAQNLPWRGVMK